MGTINNNKIIVGIDPGANIGLAIFDINANLLNTVTIKNGGKKEVINEILKYGSPLIIVSDVSHPSTIVVQVASYFNAKIFFQKKDIPENEKNYLSKDFSFLTKHERDSIAAVIKFFKTYDNKIRWIEKMFEKNKMRTLNLSLEETKCFVLMGMPFFKLTDTKYNNLLQDQKLTKRVEIKGIEKIKSKIKKLKSSKICSSKICNINKKSKYYFVKNYQDYKKEDTIPKLELKVKLKNYDDNRRNNKSTINSNNVNNIKKDIKKDKINGEDKDCSGISFNELIDLVNDYKCKRLQNTLVKRSAE